MTASVVAVAVGGFALALPGALLAGKGVGGAAVEVWVREVGVLLLPVEPLAWRAGVIREPAGIVPNTVLHVLLAVGFGHQWLALRGRSRRAVAPDS